MGVQIILGGAAGQFGSGLGKGLNEGIDAKQAQMKADAEKQALADDYTAAMKMFIAPQVEALEGQIPAQLEPQGPLLGPGAGPLAAGVQGPPEAPNAVPEYMRPRPNPEREQLDAIAQQFALGVSSLREPEAIKLATQAASQQLDMLQRQILVKKVNDQLSFAQRTGGFDDAEVQNFLNMGLAIAQGEGDITDLYSAIRERKQEKVQQELDFARATSFIEDNAKTVESLAMSSGAESDPTIAGWFTNQAGLLKDKLVSMQSALKFGLDDFDFDAASKEVLDIKHALNPYQEAKFKQQLEQETLRMRNYYNELEDIRSDQDLTEEERATALEAAKKAYGLTPSEPVINPGGTVDPITGEPVPEKAETASDRSMKGKTPEEVQMIEAKRQIIGRLDGVGFSGMSPERVDDRLSQHLAALTDSLLGGTGVEVKIKDGQTEADAWAENLLGVLEKIGETDPEYMKLLGGRVARMLDLAKEAKAAPANKAKKDKKSSIDTDMGAAAWGGS
jgi:hypothetical protein